VRTDVETNDWHAWLLFLNPDSTSRSSAAENYVTGNEARANGEVDKIGRLAPRAEAFGG
jgi:hypothetical protein